MSDKRPETLTVDRMPTPVGEVLIVTDAECGRWISRTSNRE
jgi:hypothetical protein